MPTGPSSSRKQRGQTASQIARDTKKFSRWVAHHNMVEGTFQDLPTAYRKDVDAVYNVLGLMPEAWGNPKRRTEQFAAVLDPEFLSFLEEAFQENPKLFSTKVDHEACRLLLRELQTVCTAWVRLRRMRKSKRPWSECDYASQVYNVLRTPGGRTSDCRCQPQLSLPQPVVSTINSASVFSKTRTIIPDGALFVPTERFDKLCRSERSAFKLLLNSPLVNNAASHGGRSSFRSQSTLCWTLPEEDCFEVAGVFWEDKKPALGELKAAYRQNRMSTAASLRQLHFLKVKTPVFGLIFSEGTVQAHMDWWADSKKQGFRIVSAPYTDSQSSVHEWDLGRPSDIIALYLHIRNLDEWVANGFAARVETGIERLACSVKKGKEVQPWRRRSGAGTGSTASRRSSHTGEQSISSPVKSRQRSNPPRRCRQ